MRYPHVLWKLWGKWLHAWLGSGNHLALIACFISCEKREKYPNDTCQLQVCNLVETPTSVQVYLYAVARVCLLYPSWHPVSVTIWNHATLELLTPECNISKGWLGYSDYIKQKWL